MMDYTGDEIMMRIVELFSDLDDSDEQPFGEYARVRSNFDTGEIYIQHETEDEPEYCIVIEQTR